MDYCLNLNSSTKLKQSTRTTKQNRHFYFTNPHTLFYIVPNLPNKTNLIIAQYFILCGLVWTLKNCVWAILGRIFRYYC